MARGVKRSADEIIAGLDAKISNYQNKINDLKAQKKEALESDRTVKLQRVMEIADQRGLSVDEIIAKISQ